MKACSDYFGPRSLLGVMTARPEAVVRFPSLMGWQEELCQPEERE